MSDLLLKEIIRQNEDLYAVLELNTNRNIDININDIKKQYKVLALKYHPDKNIINREDKDGFDNKSNDLFHKISIAYEILSNEKLRIKYDQWYQNNRINRLNTSSIRTEMIRKLNKNEKIDNFKVNKKNYNLHDLQKRGQRLRKLKQLRLPYHNWDGRIVSNTTTDKNNKSYDNNKWSDSSTITVELKNLQNDNNNNNSNFFNVINENDLLLDLYSLLQLNETDVIDHYFYDDDSSGSSSTDNYGNMICLYLVLSSPKISSKIWDKWRNGQVPKIINSQIIVNDISPRLKEEFYNKKNSGFLNDDIELNPDIENLLCEPEILTETVIID